MSGPLEGIVVIDFSWWIQGPMAAAMLGDLGAEVIKVEPPDGGDPFRGWTFPGVASERSTAFEAFNRNKRSMVVNLQTQGGIEIMHKLVERADVFFTNMRSKVLARLGLDYDSLSAVNPRLVYAQGSGWGPEGPDVEKGAFDNLAAARTGFMYTTGEPQFGMPQRPTTTILDAAGAAFLALGTTAALQSRQRSGRGQKVETSLLGSAITLATLVDSIALRHGIVHQKPPRTREYSPFYNFYRCGDGEWFYLSMPQYGKQWREFWEAVGQERLAASPPYASPTELAKHSEELISILDMLFETKPRAHWLRVFEERGILCEPICTIGDLENDPQVTANRYVTEFDHPVYGLEKVIGIPYHFSSTPGSLRRPSPEYGQHTEEVLLELGYDWEQIASLKAGAVIL